jgi:hypothetical protein
VGSPLSLTLSAVSLQPRAWSQPGIVRLLTTVTDTWANNLKQEDLFWLRATEVSAHGRLVPLLLGCGEAET